MGYLRLNRRMVLAAVAVAVAATVVLAVAAYADRGEDDWGWHGWRPWKRGHDWGGPAGPGYGPAAAPWAWGHRDDWDSWHEREHKWGWYGWQRHVMVSKEYTAKVIQILESNNGTAELLGQGYRVAAVKPIPVMYVEGDGSISVKALRAIVVLVGQEPWQRVRVLVDLVNGTATVIGYPGWGWR